MLANAIYMSYFPFSSVIVANIIYWIYIGIYTPMKMKSSMNTHVGAVSGSLPAILGYAAAGGALMGSINFFNFVPW